LDKNVISELENQAEGLNLDELSDVDDDLETASSPVRPETAPAGRRPRQDVDDDYDEDDLPDDFLSEPLRATENAGRTARSDEREAARFLDEDDFESISAVDADLGLDQEPESLREPKRQKAENGSDRLKGKTRRLKRSGDEQDQEDDGEENDSRLPPAKKAKPTRSLFFRFCFSLFWAGLGLVIAGLAALFLCYAFFSQDLPSVEVLKNYKPKTVTYFYSLDGEVIGEYSHERRVIRPLSAMPEHLKQAYLATEDANFYRHGGINPIAIVRAAYKTIVEDSIQGASTITQQLTRAILLSPERKLERKIKEIILSFRVESVLTKDQIFELYLNQIYLGHGAYGVESAAQTYFDKHVEQLSLAESAMIAGMTQLPEGKNPITRPEAARERQMHALSRMVEVGYITREEADEAAAEILNVVGAKPNPNTTVAPYFTEHVRRVLAEQIGEESLYNDGWKVYTTLDLRAQRAADVAVARGLREYARRRGFKGPIGRLEGEAAINAFRSAAEAKLRRGTLQPERLYEAVILELGENQSLKVAVGEYEGVISKKNLEWILPKGALNKQLSVGDIILVRIEEPAAAPETEGGLDRRAALASIATGLDQTGLSFILEQRTDVQAALLSMDLADGGVRAMVGGRDFGESQFNRATQSQRQPGSSFKPIVYTAAIDNGFTPGSIMVDGPVVIDDPGTRRRWKPLNSDHKFLGPMTLYSALVASRNLVSIKVLERIGFEALDETARNMGITTTLPHSPPVALGAHGVTMPEMLTAYSSFPNQGQRVDPRYINRIEDRNGRTIVSYEPIFHQAISSGTACVLTSMLRGVVAQGTGSSVRPLQRPVGGKTGTTNDYSDAWFVGFTPEYVTAVWMGTDELKPRAVGEVGGRASGPIFLYYMQDVLKDKPIVDFKVPSDAVMTPGGAFGICYKEGTVGTGISETVLEAAPEEDFMRRDFEDGFTDVVSEDYSAMAPESALATENDFQPWPGQ
jgi:penicillin-binding protein 1A